MKVLQKGKPKKRWQKKHTCKDCKAILLVDENDMFVTTHPHLDIELQYHFICPECNFRNTINWKQITISAKKNIGSRASPIKKAHHQSRKQFNTDDYGEPPVLNYYSDNPPNR